MEPHTEHGHEGRPLELGKNRIEALSDGIFAIAMTLLILEFQVPKLPHDAPNVLVVPALLHLWPKFVSYVVAFVSLGVFWVGHHNMYHAIKRADRFLLWLNIFFFMFVSFLPFSTSVLNAFPETEIAPLVFGGNLTIIGWLLFLQWRYAVRQHGMLADFVPPEFRAQVQYRFLLYPVVSSLTMAICFWSIPISLAIYMILLPLYMIPGGRTHAEASGPVDGGRDTVPSTEGARVADSAPGPIDDNQTATTTHRDPRTVSWPRIPFDKKVLIPVALLALVIVGWAAFRPELIFVNQRAHDSFPTGAASMATGAPVVIAGGTFHGVAHQTRGYATVYRFADGSRIMRLMDFATSNGPDVHVFLISAPDATDNDTFTRSHVVELGKMKGNIGDQNYDLPAGVDLAQYHAVTLWCLRFHVNFGTAPLTPMRPT
jgi:uncharacterized membrane protein